MHREKTFPAWTKKKGNVPYDIKGKSFGSNSEKFFSESISNSGTISACLKQPPLRMRLLNSLLFFLNGKWTRARNGITLGRLEGDGMLKRMARFNPGRDNGG